MSDYDPTCPDDVAPREWARIRSLEARIATLTAEVMHYTAGTPHPELALRQTAEAYAARNALRVIEVEAALREMHDVMVDISVQSSMSAVHRMASESISKTYAALGITPAETACTCDSTLVTDTSNHQPHCPRYVAETKGDGGG